MALGRYGDQLADLRIVLIGALVGLLSSVVPYTCELRWDVLAKAVGAPLRLAADGEALTGFRHGAVSPLGSARPLAVVVAKQLARRRFFWLGGGEVDVKLRVFTSQLLREGGAGAPGASPLVLDIAEEVSEAGAD